MFHKSQAVFSTIYVSEDVSEYNYLTYVEKTEKNACAG
jgi:hypothetical protein